MSQYELIAPCHFGMEAVLKREIQDLGYQIIKTEDGKVTFAGDESAFARANLFLRTAESVLWKVGSFRAETFEELFEGTKNLPWEEYLPPDAKFWAAKATSIRSRLFSSSDIQSIVKKAIVERMKFKYRMEWFPESGSEFPLRVSLLKDEVTIGIDTSGESLHKRGYRRLTSRAPLTETLAAAIIMLTPWKQDRLLVDPFCGSGTIPIEAAMIGANIAPGLNRSFTAKGWSDILPEKIWTQAAEEANDRIRRDIEMNIQGYDIDKDIVAAARKNAKLAGVEQYIHFQQRELVNLQSSRKYGFIITNPPYGERLEDKASMPLLYRQIGQAFRGLDSWSMYLLTGYEEAERYIGRKADKNRKIYNGMLKTYLYQFLGPKPLRSGAQR
ncbi:MAG TPA: class I SAM-dependent RNA methyltransferase [Candidatus Caccomorpha excrementavium]|nr:class I SAM-dependent RNA methyltransferase [Candidatus Caccomorpha excrementavium]